uniref:Uncharacterized protein n=1 Tax=Spironucleus salmonicida TaxID=348837 RepID=V6M1D5_9EUKA|eukprot:EST46994.1 Hypothetical protein SS50377_12947 [Spironucleus salmonicida]
MNRRTLEPLSAIHAAPAAVSRSHHLRDLLPRSATPKQGRCQPTSTLCEAESAHGPKTMETLLRTPPPRVGGPAGAPLSAAGPAASFTLGNSDVNFWNLGQPQTGFQLHLYSKFLRIEQDISASMDN